MRNEGWMECAGLHEAAASEEGTSSLMQDNR